MDPKLTNSAALLVVELVVAIFGIHFPLLSLQITVALPGNGPMCTCNQASSQTVFDKQQAAET